MSLARTAKRNLRLIRTGGLVIVATLTLLSCTSGTSTKRKATSLASTTSLQAAATTTSAVSAATSASANGSDFANHVCQAIVAAQTGLAADEKVSGQPAVPGAYLAQFTLKRASAFPLSELRQPIDDKQVESSCPDPYHLFLTQAKITSLATMS